MTNLVANDTHVQVGDNLSIQKGSAVDIVMTNEYVQVLRVTGARITFRVSDTTINGTPSTAETLYSFLKTNLFKAGGGATGGGVASVTGSLVSGTSENPVIDNPLLEMHRVIIVNEGNRTITDFNNTVALVRNVLEEINSFTLTWGGLDTETDRKIIMFTFDCDNITHVGGSGVTLNNLPTSCRNGQAIEVVYDKFFNTWDLVGLSSNGGNLPTGNVKQVVGFNSIGEPIATRIGVPQLTDIGGFPSFANGVLVATGMNPATQDGLLLFTEFSTTTPKPGTFPTYSTGGVLKVANGVADDDAVNLSQLNESFRGYDGLITMSTSRSALTTDVGNKLLVIDMDNAILTLPANSSSFAVGSVINVINITNTLIEIKPAGVYPTIISNNDMLFIADKAAAHLIYLGNNTWFLEGELTVNG